MNFNKYEINRIEETQGIEKMENVLERRKERLDDLLVDVAELRELVGKLKGDNDRLRGCLNNCKIVMLKMPMAWFSSNDHKSLMEAQKCLKELGAKGE